VELPLEATPKAKVEAMVPCTKFKVQKVDGACYIGTYLESLMVQIKGVVWLGNNNLHWTRASGEDISAYDERDMLAVAPPTESAGQFMRGRIKRSCITIKFIGSNSE